MREKRRDGVKGKGEGWRERKGKEGREMKQTRGARKQAAFLLCCCVAVSFVVVCLSVCLVCLGAWTCQKDTVRPKKKKPDMYCSHKTPSKGQTEPTRERETRDETKGAASSPFDWIQCANQSRNIKNKIKLISA